MKCVRSLRRGATAVQVSVVLGVVTLVVIGAVTQLGSKSSGQLTQVASNVGNPSSLVGGFGNASGGSSSGSSSSGSGTSGTSGSSGSSGSSGTSGTGSSGSGSSGSVCP
jgi:Flp pilus assembly pilin Flp